MNRWQRVVTAGMGEAWWDLLRKTPEWFLHLACGHYVLRCAKKAPKRVRCEGCGP